MKNNLLTEIKHIKHLMGLNEANNQECEKQLEDAGYVVYNRVELQKMDADCEERPKIKCVKKWLDDNNIKNYSIGKHAGICYIVAQSENKITHTVGTKSKEIYKKTYAFWDNGDITYVSTFDVLQKWNEGESDEKTLSQVQFKGKYVCGGSDINFENVTYQGVYEFDKYDDLIKSNTIAGSFMTKKSDGNDYVRLVNYHDTIGTLNPF
jgi:hypothetical protein